MIDLSWLRSFFPWTWLRNPKKDVRHSVVSRPPRDLHPTLDIAQVRLLCVGLDAAGKTTAVYRLKLGEIVTTIPTIGHNHTQAMGRHRHALADTGMGLRPRGHGATGQRPHGPWARRQKDNHGTTNDADDRVWRGTHEPTPRMVGRPKGPFLLGSFNVETAGHNYVGHSAPDWHIVP